MRSVTSGFKTILNSGAARKYLIEIDFNLEDSTSFTLTEADIWEDSFSMETASSGTSTFDIGDAIIGKCTFTLNNMEGDYDGYDFFNAEATVWLGLEGDVVNNQQQYYRMGFYTVDEPTKANGLITLTLLDNMWLFDVPFTTPIMHNSTCGSIVRSICSRCGVTLGTQNFNGVNFPITVAPENVSEMNCREVLQYMAMIGCNFCYIDSTGALRIEWYRTEATSETTVKCDYNQNTSFGTENITVTGISFTIDNEAYPWGSDGYRLELENPFVNADNVEDVIDSIWDVLEGFSFRTFNVTTASDLSAEIGDKIKIKDYQGNYVYSYITTNSFKLANHIMQCNAQPPNRTLTKRYSKEVKEAVVKAREQSVQLISNYDQSVQRLNKLVEQSMGAYSDYEESPNGGRIYYISNMPITKDPDSGECSFEPNSIVWRMAGDVFSVSNDGGDTWVNGYDPSTGELVVNVLSAIGVQADWIRTGTLHVGGSTSGTAYPVIEVLDTSDNVICTIDRNGITMHQGIISSPDYAEVSGATYSTTGMMIDVLNKVLRSPYFAIDTNGAYFKGTILITDTIDLGTGNKKFNPAEYGIYDNFDFVLQAPDEYSGSCTYTIEKSTNGSTTTQVATGTITNDEPVTVLDLVPLSEYPDGYYTVTVTDTTIRTTIPDAIYAYVGADGFKGRLKGDFEGSVDSKFGNLKEVYYGAHGSERLMEGVFKYPQQYSSNHTYLDFPNGAFYIGQNGGGGSPTSVKARVDLSESGYVALQGSGDSANRVLRIVDSGITNCDISVRTGQYGGNIVRTYESGGTYYDQSVVWDDGNFMKYSEVQTSTTDSPPQSLANGHLFLVVES